MINRGSRKSMAAMPIRRPHIPRLFFVGAIWLAGMALFMFPGLSQSHSSGSSSSLSEWSVVSSLSATDHSSLENVKASAARFLSDSYHGIFKGQGGRKHKTAKWPHFSTSSKAMQASRHDHIAVAMIFDDNKLENAQAVLRSVAYYTKSKPVVAHLVAPASLHPLLGNFLRSIGLQPHLYDFELCKTKVAPVLPFSNPEIHVAAHCKLFLADIITDAGHALYIDNDVVTTADLGSCYPKLSSSALFAMTVDTGDVCQMHPDKCWPMSLEYRTPASLRCGNTPDRYNKTFSEGPGAYCPEAGDAEPAQVNGGVLYMELARMRAASFTARLLSSIATTASIAGKVATWGEQDYINSYIRHHPSHFDILPCGCNYQFSSIRRTAKCPNEPVTIAHAWSANLRTVTKNPYNRLFFHFYLEQEGNAPEVPLISSAVAGSPEEGAALDINRHCHKQNYDCQAPDERIQWGMPVYILTRTSGRPSFFSEQRRSILSQTYPNIRHFVMTDDKSSMDYLQDVQDAELQVPYSDDTFDPTQVCRKCSGVTSYDVGPNCARAPPLGHPERQTFLSCYCDTDYPMNSYINKLFDRVEGTGRAGWVIILDDDNLLTSPTAISDLMLKAEHPDQLLLSRSQLGRATPSDANLYAKTVVRGDIDASNYAFHTKHIKSARWTGQRCADWRSIDTLSKQLEVKWVETTTVMSHPLRAALGGLGGRHDMSEKATVILTSYQAEGLRPIWVKNTIEMYCSEEYRVVVDRVILLWNNPDVPPPSNLASCAIVVSPPVNSLNNRWIATLPHIRTKAILNLDDDVNVTKDGLFCLLNYFAEDSTRLVGPFVRRNEGGKYVIDELIKGDQAWTIMLPRIMMLSRDHLETYAAPQWAELRAYVDEQEAHCDDLVLNTVIASTTEKAPLRVLLPPGSIEDQYNSCYPTHRQATGGLGLQGDRTKLRNECMAHILAQFPSAPLVPSSEVGVCGLGGSRGTIQPASRIDIDQWRNATFYPSCPDIPEPQIVPKSLLPSK